jgi:hypothetical protein
MSHSEHGHDRDQHGPDQHGRDTRDRDGQDRDTRTQTDTPRPVFGGGDSAAPAPGSAENRRTLPFDFRRTAQTLGEALRSRLSDPGLAARPSRTDGKTAPTLPPMPGTPIPPAPKPPTPSFASALSSRAAASQRHEFVPLHDRVIRFDLAPLLNAFIDDQALAVARGAELTPETVVRLFEADRAKVSALRARLDAEWDAFGMKGAALVYNWIDDVRSSIAARLTAIEQPSEVLVAQDLMVVLNVLARSRGTILLANAPLALERSFLTRSLATDDPRFIAWAGERVAHESIRITPQTSSRG